MDHDPKSQPHDHLSNERTFLAWVRTSISVIVFGFVVAKFGITLREFLRFENLEPRENGISLALGVSFMVVGILMAILAIWRYQSTRIQIEQANFPAGKEYLCRRHDHGGARHHARLLLLATSRTFRRV